MSNPHLHTVKSCPEKSRLIKNGDYMHSVMIAIKYSYKLDRRKYFNLLCELGWFCKDSHNYAYHVAMYLHPVVAFTSAIQYMYKY